MIQVYVFLLCVFDTHFIFFISEERQDKFFDEQSLLLCPILIFLRPVQPMKALLPIEVTFESVLIDKRPVQPRNASSPIDPDSPSMCVWLLVNFWDPARKFLTPALICANHEKFTTRSESKNLL